MNSPYRRIPIHAQVCGCLLLIAVSLAWGHYMTVQGASLLEKLPNGIRDFEIVWSESNARRVLSLLGDDGVAVLRLNTKMDFIFLLMYPLTLSLSISIVVHFLSGRMSSFGNMLAWAVLFAAPLDATENVAMLQMTSGDMAMPWPQIATVSSITKFALIFCALSFVLLSPILLLFQRGVAHERRV